MAAKLFPAMVRAVLRPDAELRRARKYQELLEARLALPGPATPARRLQHARDVMDGTVDGLIQATLPGPAVGYLLLLAWFALVAVRLLASPRRAPSESPRAA